ncbi:MAG: AGE family epimerase/isomerase [Verrucomicrobium sp.]|nr:AGE family epimerase/isomerase [Verrucomicrobium sp.]
MSLIDTPAQRAELTAFYRTTLVEDVMPFWLRHGLDGEQGGILTCLDRDGSILDTDKSLWFQGRAGWMFATLYHTLEPREEWLSPAQSCVSFLDRHGYSPSGKMYFTVTREGRPLRQRRYAYSESFAAIAHAKLAAITGSATMAEQAIKDFASYLIHAFEPGATAPKVDPQTRPSIGLGPLMIGLATAQELRAALGDLSVSGRTFAAWADHFIGTIERYFYKEDLQVLLETVSPDGAILDHFEGRTLNPGHALECAWFILHEGRLRGEQTYLTLGLKILDCMWQRGWDVEHGGLYYFRDLHGKPVQEYWHDMKFWWPHCEAIIATLLAWDITQDAKYATWHQQVHDWSFRHFPDAEQSEWYGYLHRDGTPSVTLKGNLWKGPFHLPRMLLLASNILGRQ